MLVFASASTTYASEYQVLNPSKKAFSTRNRVVLVNGKAPTDTRVIIDLYGTTDLTRKSFNLANLPKNEDYIKRLTTEARSGNMGFFQKELELALGVNKLNISFRNVRNTNGQGSEEIIIYVYDQSNLINQKTLINLR